MEKGGERHAPTALSPGWSPGTQCRKKVDWAPRSNWTVVENKRSYPNRGLEPRTIHPVTNRYTVYSIPKQQMLPSIFSFCCLIETRCILKQHSNMKGRTMWQINPIFELTCVQTTWSKSITQTPYDTKFNLKYRVIPKSLRDF